MSLLWQRPQLGLGGRSSAVETFYRVKRGNTQVIRVENLEALAGGRAFVGTVQRE